MQRYLIGIMFAFLLGISTVFAQDTQATPDAGMAKLLPPGTLAYLSIDAPGIKDGVNSLSLLKFFKSPEWELFRGTFDPNIENTIKEKQKEFEEQIEITVDEILSFFQGDISLALINVEMKENGPFPDLVFSWNAGDKITSFMELLGKLRQMLVQQKNLTESTYNYKDIPVIMFGKEPMFLYLASKDNRMFLATNQKTLEAILDMPKETLADNPGFQKVQNKVMAGNRGILFYFNVNAALQLFNQIMGEKAEELNNGLKLVGLDALEYVGFGVTFRGGSVIESFYIDAPKRAGLLGAVVPPSTADPSLVADIPADAWYFSHGKVNIAGIINEFLAILQQTSKHEYKDVQRTLGEFKKHFELSFMDDILGNITGDYLFYSVFTEGGALLPEFVFELELKDATKFWTDINKIFSRLPEEVMPFTVKWGEHEFVYLNFSTEKRPIPVAPTFAIKGNKLLFALWPETIKQALTRPLSKHRVFGENGYFAGVPYNIVKFLDLKRGMVFIFNTVLPFVEAMVPKEPRVFEPTLFPSAQVLAKYLEDLRSIVIQDKDGVLVELHSPFGYVPIMVAGGITAYQIQNKMQRERFEKRRRWDKRFPK